MIRLKTLPIRMMQDVRVWAIPVSLLLSWWAVWSAPIINNDGVIYIAAARELVEGDWDGAYRFYNWPLYPWLIALTSQAFGSGLEISAQLVDAAFSAIMAFTFLTLVRDLGADKKTLWIAAFVILFHPYLNDSREEIVRDHAYWTFYLAGILFFLRFLQRRNSFYAIAWSVAMAAATLFRIEGLVFLFFLPLILLLIPGQTFSLRIRDFLRANFLALVLLALTIVVALLAPDFISHWANRLEEPGARLTMLWNELSNGLAAKADIIRSEILTPFSREYALPVIYGALVLILLDTVINTLSPLYCALPLIPRLRARFRPRPATRWVLVWLVALNIGVVSVFVTTEFFMASRYIVPLVLTLLVMAPFVLASLHDQWLARHNLSVVWKGVFAISIVLLVFMTGDGLIAWKGSNRVYLREAGEWIKDNIPADARLLTNDEVVRYYSGRQIMGRDWSIRKINFQWLKNDEWKEYEYLAIAINRYARPKQVEAVEKIPATRLFSSRNRRNERVLVMKLAPD